MFKGEPENSIQCQAESFHVLGFDTSTGKAPIYFTTQ